MKDISLYILEQVTIESQLDLKPGEKVIVWRMCGAFVSKNYFTQYGFWGKLVITNKGLWIIVGNIDGSDCMFLGDFNKIQIKEVQRPAFVRVLAAIASFGITEIIRFLSGPNIYFSIDSSSTAMMIYCVISAKQKEFYENLVKRTKPL